MNLLEKDILRSTRFTALTYNINTAIIHARSLNTDTDSLYMKCFATLKAIIVLLCLAFIQPLTASRQVETVIYGH